MRTEAQQSQEVIERPDIDDVRTRLSELEQSAGNEQVLELLDALDLFVSEFKRVDAQRRRLKNRVDRLEARFPQHTKSPSSNVSTWDTRDERVIEVLDSSDNDRVTVDALKNLYRRHTDIRNPRTLKDRVKSLTASGEFNLVSPGVWDYTPNID